MACEFYYEASMTGHIAKLPPSAKCHPSETHGGLWPGQTGFTDLGISIGWSEGCQQILKVYLEISST